MEIITIIVETDPIWRDSIEDLLAKEQAIHVISSVATVQEVLQYISEVDIVVLDINLEAYIDKLNYDVLPTTIREVIHTRSPFQILLEDYQKLRRDMTFHTLTPAENEIIDLIIKGYTLSSISLALHKADSTVKNQVGSIYKKMNVNNRQQLIEVLQ